MKYYLRLESFVKDWDCRCVTWAQGKKLPAWVGHIPVSAAVVTLLFMGSGHFFFVSLLMLVLLVYFRQHWIKVAKAWDHRCVLWARDRKLPDWAGHVRAVLVTAPFICIFLIMMLLMAQHSL